MSTKNSKWNGKRSSKKTSSRRPSRHHQRRYHAEDAKRQAPRRHGESFNGRHLTESHGSRQEAHHAEANGHHHNSNICSQQTPCTAQRPRETTHITDPQEACRKWGGPSPEITSEWLQQADTTDAKQHWCPRIAPRILKG